MDSYFFKERTEKLCDILVPHIFTGFHDLYRNAKRLNYEMGRTRDKVLMTFQLCLKRVPDVPHYQLEKDYGVLAERLKKNGFPQDWLQKIITDIFMTYAKSHLVSLGASEKLKIRRIDLNIPENVDFIHKCYVECARCFWQEPYLFSDNYSSMEVQKNQVLAQQKIKDSIYKTIRALVPLDQLVSIYHVGYSESIPESGIDLREDDFEEGDRSSMHKSKLQRLLDSELGKEVRVGGGKEHRDRNKSRSESENYAKLNRENLDKLQQEIAKNTLVQRTKTLSTVSTHHTKSVDQLLKQANNKIQEVKKIIDNVSQGEIGTAEIERHLDKKMSKMERTEENRTQPEIKSITIKKKGDYSVGNTDESVKDSEIDACSLGTEMKNKLSRVNELLRPQMTETSDKEDKDYSSENDNNMEESRTTIEIKLNNDKETSGGGEKEDEDENGMEMIEKAEEAEKEDRDEDQDSYRVDRDDAGKEEKKEKQEKEDRVEKKDKEGEEDRDAEDNEGEEDKGENNEANEDIESSAKDVIEVDREDDEYESVEKDNTEKEDKIETNQDIDLLEEDLSKLEIGIKNTETTETTDTTDTTNTTNTATESTYDLEHLDTWSTTLSETETLKTDLDKPVEVKIEKTLDDPKATRSTILDLLGKDNLYQLLEKAKGTSMVEGSKVLDENKESHLKQGIKNLENAILHPNKKIK